MLHKMRICYLTTLSHPTPTQMSVLLCPPGVLSAGQAPQCHCDLSEYQRAESAAAAFSEAAADHAD